VPKSVRDPVERSRHEPATSNGGGSVSRPARLIHRPGTNIMETTKTGHRFSGWRCYRWPRSMTDLAGGYIEVHVAPNCRRSGREGCVGHAGHVHVRALPASTPPADRPVAFAAIDSSRSDARRHPAVRSRYRRINDSPPHFVAFLCLCHAGGFQKAHLVHISTFPHQRLKLPSTPPSLMDSGVIVDAGRGRTHDTSIFRWLFGQPKPTA
jgi:hypothetical protein